MPPKMNPLVEWTLAFYIAYIICGVGACIFSLLELLVWIGQLLGAEYIADPILVMTIVNITFAATSIISFIMAKVTRHIIKKRGLDA